MKFLGILFGILCGVMAYLIFRAPQNHLLEMLEKARCVNCGLQGDWADRCIWKCWRCWEKEKQHEK